jgi:K+-transporting ATPase ATPase B chain
VVLAKQRLGARRAGLQATLHHRALHGPDPHERRGPARSGAPRRCARARPTLRRHVEALGGACRPVAAQRRRGRAPRQHAAGGGRRRARLGVVELKDIVKGGIKERFAELRRMGIKTVMITGDNR